MIVFRHADSEYPFLWENDRQPAARWHDTGEGPVAYFAETSDGAWAEFLRHEDIKDADDLAGINRSIWAVEIIDPPTISPNLPNAIMVGDLSTYPKCQDEARTLRSSAPGFVAPSAALLPNTSAGFHTNTGLQPAAPRLERVFVLFGMCPTLTGWCVCFRGRPRDDILARVRYLR